MFGEPASGVLVDSESSWQPKGYLAWLEARTLVRGRYELQRYVGSGSVGSVFVARHIGFDETVALKFLQPRYLASSDTVQHFMREARAGFKLRSEHVARIYDVDVHEEVPFIATEMLEGETLRVLLKQRGAFGRATSVDYALQVCEALACAHAVGSLHFDIKPENVFVLDEHIKLVDFSMSKLFVEADTSSLVLRYVAPEGVRGAAAAADARSDMWSLACVLYELLSGRAAFDRGGLLATCAAVLEEEPVALTTLPEGLWSVIARCLQKSPGARYADVAELAAALEPFGTGRYSHYAERCRALLRPEVAVKTAPPTAAVVSVQPTMVLGQVGAGSEPLQAAPKPTSRTATLAFDVSAFASAEEVVRELESNSSPEEHIVVAIEDHLVRTRHEPELQADIRPSSPGKLLVLMGTLVCLAWGGFALFSAPEKQPETPKLMHLVTPK